MSKKNETNVESNSPAPQLDALIVLLGELLQQTSGDKESTQAAREKAAAILVAGGLTQERAAKLLGMQKKKVVRATKTLKL